MSVNTINTGGDNKLNSTNLHRDNFEYFKTKIRDILGYATKTEKPQKTLNLEHPTKIEKIEKPQQTLNEIMGSIKILPGGPHNDTRKILHKIDIFFTYMMHMPNANTNDDSTLTIDNAINQLVDYTCQLGLTCNEPMGGRDVSILSRIIKIAQINDIDIEKSKNRIRDMLETKLKMVFQLPYTHENFFAYYDCFRFIKDIGLDINDNTQNLIKQHLKSVMDNWMQPQAEKNELGDLMFYINNAKAFGVDVKPFLSINDNTKEAIEKHLQSLMENWQEVHIEEMQSQEKKNALGDLMIYINNAKAFRVDVKPFEEGIDQLVEKMWHEFMQDKDGSNNGYGDFLHFVSNTGGLTINATMANTILNHLMKQHQGSWDKFFHLEPHKMVINIEIVKKILDHVLSTQGQKKIEYKAFIEFVMNDNVKIHNNTKIAIGRLFEKYVSEWIQGKDRKALDMFLENGFHEMAEIGVNMSNIVEKLSTEFGVLINKQNNQSET